MDSTSALLIVLLVAIVVCTSAIVAAIMLRQPKTSTQELAHLAGQMQALNENVQGSQTRTHDLMVDVVGRLEHVKAAQAQLGEVGQSMVSLQDILANRQARGVFGEAQLTAIVKDALPATAYDLQSTLSNGTRVDCLLHLPEPAGDLAVDAKFALDAYKALIAAKDEAALKSAQRQFRTDMTKHITDIASKYIIPGETADGAILFLPSEAVFAELHANFYDLVEKAYKARVWIVSPTTLMATLNTLTTVLKDAEMRREFAKVQKVIGLLADDTRRLLDRVGKLATHHAQAGEDLEQIQKSAKSIFSRGERIRAVELDETDSIAAE